MTIALGIVRLGSRTSSPALQFDHTRVSNKHQGTGMGTASIGLTDSGLGVWKKGVKLLKPVDATTGNLRHKAE